MHKIAGSKFLVTGGAGFVGSSIADQLLVEGAERITILDNLIRGSRENIAAALSSGKADFVEGDIRDLNLLNELLDPVDYCFHMAALRISHCASEPREAFEVMFEGTFNVAEACVKQKIKKVVLASSASIYGEADNFPTKEDHHPYNNRTLYGAAKTAGEGIFRSFHDMYGLDYCALRYFNIYGPRMDVHGKYTEVLIRWYHKIRKGEEPLIYGDGKQTMDFVYVEDVARANVLAMKTMITDQIFNVGSGVETSLEELCWLLLAVMDSDLKPKYVPIPADRRKVEVSRRRADVSRAREQLGFEMRVPLRKGLENLVKWLDTQLSNHG
jgi:UDP-glucose 4-epimerase